MGLLRRTWNRVLRGLYALEVRRARRLRLCVVSYALWREMNGVPIRYPRVGDLGF